MAAIGEDAQPYSSMAGRLHPDLLRGLQAMGFEKMTPVQQRVLTSLPSFSSDCLVQAKTGTGKTCAFLLPTLHTLLTGKKPPHGQVCILVISPTRELALQIAKECDQLTSQSSVRIECHTAFGGTARASNLKKFTTGNPAVLVATPGRLKDYLTEPAIAARFASVRTVILDEADTMLEAGFLADVRQILKTLPPKRQAGWQGMCFSATVPEKIRDVIDVILGPSYTSLSTVDKNEVPTVERVPQYQITYPNYTQMFTVMASLLAQVTENDSKIIVFGITANLVALYAKLFAQNLTKVPVFEIHSRLNQNIRTRTTEDFKKAASGIMFASDVIGRGMDFPNVDLVIQVGLPSSGEQYVHRVGRTGRAGKSGEAILLLTHAESFFLKRNPQLPIKPHPASASILANADATFARPVEQAMHRIDETVKQRAYSSFMGFFAGSGFLKPLQLDKAGLVRLSNDFAVLGMHCPEPPPMEKKAVGKMGLKGVPGINFNHEGANRPPANGGAHNPKRQSDTDGWANGGRSGDGEPKRARQVQQPNGQQSNGFGGFGGAPMQPHRPEATPSGRGRGGHRPRRGGARGGGRGGMGAQS